MTKEELASKLNGRQYRSELIPGEGDEAKRSGLIIAFGYSDDNLELRGVTHDEIGAYEGVTATVAANGELISDDEDEVPYAALIKAGWTPPPSMNPVLTIIANWSPKDPDASWLITSDAPFAPFDIYEDGELFCRGAVIDFAAAVAKNASTK